MVATRCGLHGAAVADVSYLITQELTTQSGRQLVSCKYVNTGKRCNAWGRGADKHPWSCSGGGCPWSPCAGRWAARNPDEKRLPTRPIRQEGGLQSRGTLWESGGVPSWRVAKGKAEQGWERENGHAKISAKCSRGA